MLQLVIDTNLFHEFQRLEDIPWDELSDARGASEIVLLLTDPVQTELDDHKKSDRPRIRRRAIELGKLIRGMILGDLTEHVVREADPRVVLRLDDTDPDRPGPASLDLAVPDDRLVAIAKAIAATTPDVRTAVFTDDTRPLRKAKGVGLESVPVPDEWRRKPEESEERKQIRELEAELRRARSAEPQLELSVVGQQPEDFVLPVYDPLTLEEIDALVGRLQERFLIETCFDRLRNETSRRVSGASSSIVGITQMEFHPPPEREIAAYRDNAYPDWVEMCRKQFEMAHLILWVTEARLPLCFALSNLGTRPANDMRLTVRCQGPLLVWSDGDDVDQDDSAWTKIDGFDLPQPPAAPQGHWKVKDPFGDLGFRSALGGGRDGGMFGIRGSEFLHPTVLPPVRLPDPNRFHHVDEPKEPVTSYAMTCKQFRHAGEREVFSVVLTAAPDAVGDDQNRRGLFEVVAEASNLSQPVRLRIRLRLVASPHSTMDAATEAMKALRSAKPQ